MIRNILKKNKILIAVLAISIVLVGCASTSGTTSRESALKEDTVVEKTEETTEEAKSEEKEETPAQDEEVKNYEGLVIRVGSCDFALWSAIYDIAQAEGFFEEEFGKDGIKVETFNFANGPAGNEAFIAGEIDLFNGMGDQPFVSAIGNDSPITLLSVNGERGQGLYVVVNSDSGIDKIEDLKGKKIGVYIGTQVHKQWIQLLGSVGLTEDDVEFVNITNFNDNYAAFTKGDIDAFQAENYNYKEIDDGSVKTIADFADYPSRCYIIGRNEFINEYPELTQRFIDVLVRTQKWFYENEDNRLKGLKDFADYSGIDFEKVVLGDSEQKLFYELSDEIVDGVKYTHSFLKEKGIYTFDVTDEQWNAHFDSSFVDNALKNQ